MKTKTKTMTMTMTMILSALPRRGLILALSLVAGPGSLLAAQTDEQVAAAAATITPAEIAHHIGVLAHDSMRGRDTPSRELELAAQYLATQFAEAGLSIPSGDKTTHVRRYPLQGMPGVVVPDSTMLDSTLTAPAVIGKLASGGEKADKSKYIIFVAHMDHLGIRVGRADSIANGADDNASGVAGLILLAKAFQKLGVPPRRNILFLAVSGGAKELWGSRHYAKQFERAMEESLFPIYFDAALNLDMIGRPTGNTIAIAGLTEVNWPTPPSWIASAHPELGVTVVDGGSLFRPSSDHYPFVQAWIPSLSFQNGSHDPPAATDTPAAIDAAQEARILQLAFYVGVMLANSETAPQWTEASRTHLRQWLLGQGKP